MTPFLDEQFSDMEQELKMTNKSKSNLRNKVLQNTVIIKKRELKNNRVWQYNTFTVILIAAVIMFLGTQSLDTLSRTADKLSYSDNLFEATEVKMMDKVVVQDIIEFTIQSSNFGKVINPTNSGPTTTPNYKFNGNNGEVYLDLLVTVRNISSTELFEDDFMGIEIIYNNKEKFSSFTSFEKFEESKFAGVNNSSIKPLQTRVVHFLASVPASVEKDGKPLKAIITANGENYEYVIR